MKNGQPRHIGNIGYTRHRTKTSKTEHKKLKDEQHGPYQQTWMNSGDHEG